jgi:hypothetical protein
VITLIVNGKTQRVDVPPDMPLLWAIRENLALTGTTGFAVMRWECTSSTRARPPAASASPACRPWRVDLQRGLRPDGHSGP